MTEEAKVELLPCPFCGTGPDANEHAIQVQAYFQVAGACWGVFCEHCGGEGPTLRDRREAILAWNQRTHPDLKAERDALVEKMAKAIVSAYNDRRAKGEPFDLEVHDCDREAARAALRALQSGAAETESLTEQDRNT